jgi:hypothetical protein
VSTGSLPGDKRTRGNGHGAAAGARLTAADLFKLLWEGLADVLGTAATAVIVRRAARRAASGNPELVDLVIVRETLDYRFTLPQAWTEPAADDRALRDLVRELRPLLIELTGPVVVRRLAQIPALRERGIVPAGEEQT